MLKISKIRKYDNVIKGAQYELNIILGRRPNCGLQRQKKDKELQLKFQIILTEGDAVYHETNNNQFNNVVFYEASILYRKG